MTNIFLVLSVIVSLIGFSFGIFSIIKGKFRPQRMTRFLLLLISALFVSTLFASKDRNSIYFASIMLMGTLIMFLLSLKKGMGGRSKMDVLVLFMVIGSLAVWYTTKNPLLGLLMSLLTDFLAFGPTIVKSWLMPETEDWRFYMFGVVASVLIILSISDFTFEKIVFPIYILLINLLIAFVVVGRKMYLKNK